MIQINGITKSFGANKILDHVDMQIPDGQKLAVIGPSGCGKSTLLRLMIRLSEPDSGSILIDGSDVTKLSEDDLMKVRSKIGMVFQSSALFDSMSVMDNVAFGLRHNTRLTESQISRKVSEKLSMVGLQGIELLMPSELSGGMQKRVSLARAIASDPKVILYDEPTTGLDPVTSTTIEDLINKLSAELKATSIVVTHQLSTVYRTCDRIVMLHEGRFIETGNVEQTQVTSDPVVRNFIKGGLA